MKTYSSSALLTTSSTAKKVADKPETPTRACSNDLIHQKNAANAGRLLLSQRLVFALLNKLKGGTLILVDCGQTYVFGDGLTWLRAEVHVHDRAAYKQVLFGGDIGAGEAYVEQLWSSPNLAAVIQLFSRNLSRLQKNDGQFASMKNLVGNLKHRLLNRNSKSGSRTNIAAHYDLSNDMYQLFLDKHMQYSSAIFPSPDATLEQAQLHKMRVLCERLELTPDDHLLEVGTGWGGLACYAARHYGCQVTTTTISKAQFDIAQRRVTEQGLDDKVTLLLDDYRDLKGSYSKIVSVEMIEAVGHEYMAEYFRVLNRLLSSGGKLVLQAITIEDQRYESYRRGIDFIRQYIFPGGHLPSLGEILRHLKEQTTMRFNHFSDYGDDYANTLKIWNERFLDSRQKIQGLGFSEDFIRLWEYYFNYCEGAFREKRIGLAHIEAVKSEYL